MMKRILLFVLLSIFLIPIGNAVAGQFKAFHTVFSEHRKHSNDFGGSEFWMMMAGAFTDSVSDTVYLQNYPVTGGNGQLQYTPGWSNYWPQTHCYVNWFPWYNHPNMGGPYPSPDDSSWARNYDFFIDTDNDATYDTGEPLETWTIKSADLRKIDYVSNVNISGNPINPTITWDPVDYANIYRVCVFPVINGGVDSMTLLFMSDKLTGTMFSGFGDTFSQPGDYAIFIDAREYQDPNDVNFINRSRYITKHTAPVPEPATMLLLGSGLIGLAGFRRKIRRRR